jgi:DNA-binding LacI/PurR family transcriptional regulator
VATVSYVLNNSCPVKDETRDRVLAAVRVLNYIPDLRARSMATNRTMQIAVIVSSLSDPVSCEIVEHFIHRAARDGYFVSVSIKIGSIIQNIRKVISQHMDGVFILAMPDEMESDMVYNLTDTEVRAVVGVPLSEASKRQICGIEIAEDEAFIKAAAYLREKGHVRAACLGRPDQEAAGRRALALYRSARKKRRLPEMEFLAAGAEYPDDLEAGRALGRRFLDERAPACTAVLAGNGGLARGCMEAFAERGVEVPGDISCMALRAEGAGAGLSAMTADYGEFAGRAFDMLQNFIDGNLISHYRLSRNLREGVTVRSITEKGAGSS